MSAGPVLGAAGAHALAALRVVGSFVAALGIGSLLLLPLFGPIAMIFVFGALIFGFPALVAALVLRLAFSRSFDAHLSAWCLAAPVAAVAIHFLAMYWLDYRQRGFGFVDFLSLPQNASQAGLALFYAALSAMIFYLWEDGARRRPG